MFFKVETLLESAKNGHLELVKQLIEVENVNPKNIKRFTFTPLMVAS